MGLVKVALFCSKLLTPLLLLIAVNRNSVAVEALDVYGNNNSNNNNNNNNLNNSGNAQNNVAFGRYFDNGGNNVTYTTYTDEAAGVPGTNATTEAGRTAAGESPANGTRRQEEDKERVWLSIALYEALSSYVPSSLPSSSSSSSSSASPHGSNRCTEHGRLYKRHLQNLTLWAVQMYDAGVHFPEGLLSTDTYQLGHFDQCLNVSYASHDVKGRYCLVTLEYAPSRRAYPPYYRAPDPAYYHDPPPDSVVWDYIKRSQDPRIKYKDVIHFGVCVPASCSQHEVERSLNATLIRSLETHSLVGHVSIKPGSCYVKDKEPYETGYYAMKILVFTLILISLVATIFDCHVVGKREKKKQLSYASDKIERTFLAFSLRINSEELFSEGPNRDMDTVNGGKIVTIFFIMLGHRTLYTLGSATYNPIYWEEVIITMSEMAIMNGTHIVDTFFLSGGFLAFHGLYKELEKTRKFNLPLLIIFRWLRLMPNYAFMIGIYAFVLIHLGSGPTWNLKVGVDTENCRENWWLNFLFVNNYFNTDKECLLMSWYIACDMHFFIIGAIMTYTLWKNPKVGEAMCIIALGISLIAPFVATYVGRHDGKLRLYQKLLYNPHLDPEFNSMYIKSYSRSIPYIFGIALGYVSYKLKKAKYIMPKWMVYSGSSFFILAYVAQIYSLVIYTPGRPYDPLENAIYAAMLPFTWSIGAGWILLVQYTTGWSVYNFFFVKKIYSPLSRLVYCVVLIHPAIQLVQSSSNRNPEYFTFATLVWMTFGDVSISFFLAVIMYLLVEAPLRTVVKLWLHGTPRRRESQITAEG